MGQLSNVEAIKHLMQRPDNITPAGGRPVTISELKQLSKEERQELGELARAELDND